MKYLMMVTLVALLAVSAFAGNAQYAGAVLADNPLAYWQMDTGVEPPAANSGLLGAPYDLVQGDAAVGLNTPGQPSFVGPAGGAGVLSVLENGSEWTVVGGGAVLTPADNACGFMWEAWIKRTDATAGWERIMSSTAFVGGPAGGIDFTVIGNPGAGYALGVQLAGLGNWDTAPLWADENWHHVAMTYSKEIMPGTIAEQDNRCQVWFDGLYVTDLFRYGGLNPGQEDFSIGMNQHWSWAGRIPTKNQYIDEVAVYCARDNSVISGHWAEVVPEPSGLLALGMGGLSLIGFAIRRRK